MRLSIGVAAAVTALIAPAAAQCNDGNSPQFNELPATYNQPNSCIPSGYGQAIDAGQATSQAAIANKCQVLCSTTYSSTCKAWVAQILKAADSNLINGQCFFYQSLPANPASCANAPNGGLVGGTRDNTNQCFASSSAAARSYCSSAFPPGTQTLFTKTSTPIFATTSTVTTTVSVVTVTTCPGHGFVNKRTLEARATTVPAPACIAATSVPVSRLSSACACFSIPSSTVRTITVAPTSTSITRVTTSVTSTYTSVLPQKTTFKLVGVDGQNNRHYIRTRVRANDPSYGTSYDLYYDDTDTSAPPRFGYRQTGSSAYNIVIGSSILHGAGYANGQLIIGGVPPPSLFINCEFAADGVKFTCRLPNNSALFLYQQSGVVLYQAYTEPGANVVLRLEAEDITYC